MDLHAEVAQLEARLASEVAEGALLADIETTLARLRRAYRVDPAAFDADAIGRLQRARDLARALCQFIDLLDHRDTGAVDPTVFACACRDYDALLALFEGLPVRVRIAREYEAFRALAAPATPEPVLTAL